MTIKQVLHQYPEAETELLLGDVLKQPKEFLYLHPGQQLTARQTQRLQKLVTNFRHGVPVAYLLGYKDFYGLRFRVNQATLIPRPESEWLVDRALTILKNKMTPQIIDLGTGSGCLAISIATKLPKAKVTAVDISVRALAVAKKNAQSHQTQIKFHKQNLLSGDKTKYDLIIANLPYVPKADYQKFQTNLRFEPVGALVDSQGDYVLYQQLLSQFSKNLKPNSHLLLEIDPTMKPLLDIWHKKNMSRVNVSFTRDMQGLWRYCEIHT